MNPIKPIACEQCGGDKECPNTRPSIKEFIIKEWM